MLKATIMRTTYRGSRRNLSRRSTVSRDLHPRKRIPMADINDLASRLDLPADALAGLDDVPSEEVARLVTLIDDAVAREERAVEVGLQWTVNEIPRPLGGRARAGAFGGDRSSPAWTQEREGGGRKRG